MINDKWILTDCFDTLLLRTCSADCVKKKWSKKIERLLEFRINKNKIYDIRRSAERYLISFSKNGEFDGSDLFHEIYERLFIESSLQIDFKSENDCIEKMYEAELESEKESLILNSKHVELMKNFRGSVAVVSDYNMGEKFLRRLFEYFKISNLIDRVFVSCDYGENKYRGGLYQIVLDNLNITPSQAIMYGDSLHNDVENAKKYGITAHLIKQNKILPAENFDNIKIKIEASLYPNKSNIFSFSRLSLSLYLYIERLYKRCVQERIAEVYFLSREGELLKELFDRYLQIFGGEIHTHYLYVSRKAVIKSTLKTIENEDFAALKKNAADISLEKFLEILGFSTDERITIYQEFTFDPNKVIQNWWESEEFETLKSNSVFKNIYARVKNENLKALKKYLKQNNFFDTSKLAIVDVGWKGTIQDGLYAVSDPEQMLFGFYCGVESNASFNRFNRKEGLLFSDIMGKSKNYDIWSYDHTFFERLLTASHPSTTGYVISQGIVEPVFKEYDTETKSYLMIHPIQKQLLQSFKELCIVLKQSSYDAEDFISFITKNHIEAMLNYSIKKAKFQQELYKNQVDNLMTDKTTAETNEKLFNKFQIIKKFLHRLHLLKNTEIIIKICAQNGFYFMIPFIAFFRKMVFLKK